MPINSRRAFNSRIMSSHPITTLPNSSSRATLGDRSQKILAASRIIFGLIWVVAAWLKWQPAFQSHFLDQISKVQTGQPWLIAFWLSMWFHLASINPLLFACLEAMAETALALCLMLGIFSNLTCLIGFLLSLGIWSTAEGFGGPYISGQSTDIGTALPYALLFVFMFSISAGRYYGLDQRLARRLGRWSFLATGSFKPKQVEKWVVTVWSKRFENQPPKILAISRSLLGLICAVTAGLQRLQKQSPKVVAVSRIVFGLIWAAAAWLKWQPAFQNHFLDQVSKAQDGQPWLIASWLSVWVHIISINPLLFARLEAMAETVLALCLILGAFSNLTYLIGFLLSLGIWSTAEGFGGPYVAGQSTDIGTAFPYALLFVVMFATSAGSYYGLDQWLMCRLGRWNFLATGSFKPKQTKAKLTKPLLQRTPSARKRRLDPDYPFAEQGFNYPPDSFTCRMRRTRLIPCMRQLSAHSL